MAYWALVVLLAILVVVEVMNRKQEKHILERILDLERENRVILLKILARLTPLPTGAIIRQLGEDGMPLVGMMIDNSIQAGGSGVFQVTPTPAGSAVPKADTITFAASDPAVTIAASPDGDPTKAVVSVPASDSNPNFQLACQFSGPDFPTPVDATPITVTIVPVAPPPPPLPTGGTIAQLS